MFARGARRDVRETKPVGNANQSERFAVELAKLDAANLGPRRGLRPEVHQPVENETMELLNDYSTPVYGYGNPVAAGLQELEIDACGVQRQSQRVRRHQSQVRRGYRADAVHVQR